jgi:hypothetical protein
MISRANFKCFSVALTRLVSPRSWDRLLGISCKSILSGNDRGCRLALRAGLRC